jgi:hypothetical protein
VSKEQLVNKLKKWHDEYQPDDIINWATDVLLQLEAILRKEGKIP